jgi:hypothetical protein
MLGEVVNTEDPDPNFRLTNTIAKRRAQRGLTKAGMEECGFTAGGAAPQAPAK